MQAEGEFALVKQELEGALELPGQPVKRGTMAHDHIVFMMLAEAAARLEDIEALQRYAELLETMAERDGHRPYLALAHRAWGVAFRLGGAHGKARASLEQARALQEELGLRWQLGRTMQELAELELAAGGADAARAHLDAAVELFEAVRAMPDLERARAALAEID